MNAFKKHGIERLSASSQNAWVAGPGLWAMKYLGGFRDETAAAAARGLAVEGGMNMLLHGAKLDDATKSALEAFEANMSGEITDEIDAERALIAPMLEQCLRWKKSQSILGSQVKIEHWFDGVSVPLIGYIDFTFENHPLVDLKTTKRIPSVPNPAHARQVSLYMTARGEGGALLYVSDKKSAYYEITEQQRDESLAQLHSAAISLERFLSHFDNAEDAIRSLPMDIDSFRFSDQAKLRLAEMHL